MIPDAPLRMAGSITKPGASRLAILQRKRLARCGPGAGWRGDGGRRR